MAAKKGARKRKSPAAASETRNDPFARDNSKETSRAAEAQVHLLGPGMVCDTEPRGHVRPQGRSPLEIVVDASEGFIPLWAKNTTLRWRFRDRSLTGFKNVTAAKNEIRKLLGAALLEWGNAAPVKFTENQDLWDFEIVMKKSDECDSSGCVLASAFFPDSGRHQLTLYPILFRQKREEQVATLVHEIGHAFGLRHFFADVSETAWPSQIFGTHSKFSIMNYGALSTLTNDDKNDLKRLYQMAWSGALTNINGTPIKFVQPYHAMANLGEGVVSLGGMAAAVQPQSRAAYMGPI